MVFPLMASGCDDHGRDVRDTDSRVGLCLGALIVIVAIIAATQSTSSGAEMFFSGLLLGIVVAIPIFILGVLVGAQAQVVMAALDTAVHTSPFLTNDDKERVMSF